MQDYNMPEFQYFRGHARLQYARIPIFQVACKITINLPEFQYFRGHARSQYARISIFQGTYKITICQNFNISGGMQDYNYLHSNCFEITVELSCCKYPHSQELTTEWDNNREALLAYMEQVLCMTVCVCVRDGVNYF